MNWGFMDNLAWDYAADTRGYTVGALLDYHDVNWSLRIASVLVPTEANGPDLNWDYSEANGNNIELECRFHLGILPGTIRALGYLNRADMGSYAEVLSTPSDNMDITKTRDYRDKYGFGLNVEQKLSDNIGLFSRLGWNDGATETWAFTEVDRTGSLGLSFAGAAWSRPSDTAGLAVLVNGLSPEHEEYLAAGGYGFIIGDGALNYQAEEIAEAYYLYKPWDVFSVTADFQYVQNPAYNAERGPVYIGALRLHFEL
jgi:high affinity Mn2+ porin